MIEQYLLDKFYHLLAERNQLILYLFFGLNPEGHYCSCYNISLISKMMLESMEFRNRIKTSLLVAMKR